VVDFFTVRTKRGGTIVSHSGQPWSFVLQYDNWDDFGYSTLFDVYYYDANGGRIEIGSVKIMQHGQPEGVHAPMPEAPFSALALDYCSVGQNQAYYEAVRQAIAWIASERLTSPIAGKTEPSQIHRLGILISPDVIGHWKSGRYRTSSQRHPT
jgi:hypothetical protein